MSAVTYDNRQGPMEADKRDETLRARLAEWKVGDTVLVSAEIPGRDPVTPHEVEHTLTSIDVDDALLTFMVTWTDPEGKEQSRWVYDVEKPEAKPDDDGNANAGIGVVEAQRATIDRLNRDITDLRTEHERFRMQVREIAIRVAKDENWCRNGLNAVLEELGLDPHENRWEFEVVVRFRATGTTERDEPDASFIERSIRGLEHVGLDSDWEDESFEVDEIVVNDIEQVDR